MSLDPLILFLGIIFSSIGLGYFIYGKKQKRIVPLVVGITLMAYTFFLSTWIPIVVVGVILTAIPYFVRI